MTQKQLAKFQNRVIRDQVYELIQSDDDLKDENNDIYIEEKACEFL